MFKDPGFAPPALLSNLRHNHVLHEHTVIVSVATSDVPHVAPDERLTVTTIAAGVHQVEMTFGYIDEPDVRRRAAPGPARRRAARRRRGDVLHRARDRHLDPRGRDAALARAPVRRAQPWRGQRLALLPPPLVAGVRGRHPGRDLDTPALPTTAPIPRYGAPVLRAVRSPHLPPLLQPVHLDGLVDSEELTQSDIHGDAVGCHAERVEITESRLTAVRATGSNLARLRLRDVVLEGCDLSGATLEEARIERCSFVDCRLSGAVLETARLRHVTFRSCRMDLVSLRMATGEAVRLEASDLRGSDLYAAQLPGIQLLDCDLTGADLSAAALGGSELHGSRLDQLVGVLALRDVVVDPLQAIAIGEALLARDGISITAEPTTR